MHVLVVGRDSEDLFWVNEQFIDPGKGSVSVTAALLGETLRLVELVRFDLIVFDFSVVTDVQIAKIEAIVKAARKSKCWLLANDKNYMAAANAAGADLGECLQVDKITPFILTDCISMYDVERSELKRNIA